MENYIVKFKNELKKIQSTRRETIKKGEKELIILKRIIDQDESLVDEFSTVEALIEQLSTIKIFYATEETLNTLIFNKKKNDRKKSADIINDIYDNFLKFMKLIKKEYSITQTIINAFENDKIKEPINNINYLIQHLGVNVLNIEEANKILGMSVYFNNEYSKKNKEHQIEYMDIISELAEYYNKDGTFKYNDNIEKYSSIINLLNMNSSQELRLFTEPIATFTSDYLNGLVGLLEKSNTELKNKAEEEKEEFFVKMTSTMSSKTRKALNELRKYYKNGSIINVPENLDYFYKVLEDCDLSSNEIIYIRKMIDDKISSETKGVVNYLSLNDKKIYEQALSLLNESGYLNGDEFVIKQFIEELDTISSMLEEENNKENKKYLLSDVPIIIDELKKICNRHNIEEVKTTNKLIFLTDKNNIPYISSDIDSIDSSYKKPIRGLVSKIGTANKSQYQKVLSREQLPYNMFEVISSKGHVAFVEIDLDIYVIIGAATAGNGYKELVNRLKANADTLRKIEAFVKNSNTRNAILLENETYLPLFSKENNDTMRLIKEPKN